MVRISSPADDAFILASVGPASGEPRRADSEKNVPLRQLGRRCRRPSGKAEYASYFAELIDVPKFAKTSRVPPQVPSTPNQYAGLQFGY